MNEEKILEQIRAEREKYERLLELKEETDKIKELKAKLSETEEVEQPKKKGIANKYISFCQGFAGAFGIGKKKEVKQ